VPSSRTFVQVAAMDEPPIIAMTTVKAADFTLFM
jgi:hypothetical protein